MDVVASPPGITLLGTTNRSQDVDPALKRQGRLGERVGFTLGAWTVSPLYHLIAHLPLLTSKFFTVGLSEFSESSFNGQTLGILLEDFQDGMVYDKISNRIIRIHVIYSNVSI